MADVAIERTDAAPRTVRKRASLRTALKRKSTAAFLMTLPLILLITLLVIYPAFYSLHLATLNKSMQRFIGFGNFQFLFTRETFWLVVKQSCIFAITAVVFKALIGFIVAVIIHGTKKTRLGAYHLRQSLGLMLTAIAVAFAVAIMAFLPIIGWLAGMAAWIGLLVLWVMGLLAAINGEQKPVPVLGVHFQKWFGNAFE